MADPAFLLDSNICIYVLEGALEPLRRRVEAHVPGSVVTSSIVYAEVMRGIDPSDKAKVERAEQLFNVFPVLAFDREAAAQYLRVPFKRHRFDRLIAAHALSLGLIIVTGNGADFSDVPGLKVENWTAPL